MGGIEEGEEVMKFDSLTITDVIAILGAAVLVGRAVMEALAVIWKKPIEDKKADADSWKNDADTSIGFGEAAEKAAKLYRDALQDIENTKLEFRKQDAELTKQREDINFLKDILAAKDREFLVLKQELASKNELIEKQQATLEEKNQLIESLLRKNEEQNILHRRWEVGIEILLQQMQQKNIIPLWFPTKKDQG